MALLIAAVVSVSLFLQHSLSALAFVGLLVVTVSALSFTAVIFLWSGYQQRPRCSCLVHRLSCPLWFRGGHWIVSCNPVYGMFSANRWPHSPLPSLPQQSLLSLPISDSSEEHVYCEISDLSQVLIVEETRL
ncbi:ORF16 [Psittacine aviadenovirus B]|uniref:ORF16 n=1 Tax=psittacine adenovirus 4 TaxID=2773287 RepID=A0A1P8SW93_9ADEN|nr:ORF16 [Psittacine aviadenovirus B]APY28366.1 ORF16 [psittacine adenovirus 4]